MLHLKKKSNLLLLVFYVCLVSCDSKQVFDAYKTIPKGTWHKNAVVDFPFTIKDTLQKHNLFINLRNNKNYPFSNLFVITEITFPDEEKRIDTLEYEMANNRGEFLGEGFTDIKENKLLYKENITFPAKGNYSFKIRQAMRKNNEVNGVLNLEGITEIGFRIEKVQ